MAGTRVMSPPGLSFMEESLSDVQEEVSDLLHAHWKEVAHYQDIPLDVDWDAYHAADAIGTLRIYTVRTHDGLLVGYSVYFVRANPHYKGSIQAVQDVLFIHPDRRGRGVRFIMWCDEQLRDLGVQAVYHHVKKDHNFGPMLNRIGYELVDLIYARRLD